MQLESQQSCCASGFLFELTAMPCCFKQVHHLAAHELLDQEAFLVRYHNADILGGSLHPPDRHSIASSSEISVLLLRYPRSHHLRIQVDSMAPATANTAQLPHCMSQVHMRRTAVAMAAATYSNERHKLATSL